MCDLKNLILSELLVPGDNIENKFFLLCDPYSTCCKQVPVFLDGPSLMLARGLPTAQGRQPEAPSREAAGTGEAGIGYKR